MAKRPKINFFVPDEGGNIDFEKDKGIPVWENESKAGKSYFTMTLDKDLSAGQKLVGFPVKPREGSYEGEW